MKKTTTIMAFICLLNIGKAQDMITTLNGEEIACKVEEVGELELKYKKTPDSPNYVIKKSDIFFVKYGDGTKEVYAKPTDKPVVPLTVETKTVPMLMNDEELRFKAKFDAKKNYKGKHSGAGATFWTATALSFAGLVPAVLCSIKAPKDENLRIPVSAYSENPIYKEAYRKEAHRKKAKKIWTCFGLGMVADAAIIFALSQ